MPRPKEPFALSEATAHVCVDMQRLFAEDTEWRTPWMERVLPDVVRVAERFAERTFFTRFIPARNAEAVGGTWQSYYRRWASMTLDRLRPELVELVPALARLVPPGRIVDKAVYSPWPFTGLHAELRSRGVGTLVVTGGETDVCVLATVLGAVDLGYRTVVVTDALCSSSDEAHDAVMKLYAGRYSEQVTTVTADELLRLPFP